MSKRRNKAKNRGTLSPLHPPSLRTSPTSQTLFNSAWLRKAFRGSLVIVLVPLIVGISANWLNSLLVSGVLLQPVALSSDKSLLFKLKNNSSVNINVAEFKYAPHKVSIRINRNIYADDVTAAIDKKTGKIKGLLLKEDEGIDVTQIENRVEGISLKSGDEINIRFPTDFPKDSSEEKLSFRITWEINPSSVILALPYAALKFFSVVPQNETGFFLLDQGVIQAISEKQFNKRIELM